MMHHSIEAAYGRGLVWWLALAEMVNTSPSPICLPKRGGMATRWPGVARETATVHVPDSIQRCYEQGWRANDDGTDVVVLPGSRAEAILFAEPGGGLVEARHQSAPVGRSGTRMPGRSFK